MLQLCLTLCDPTDCSPPDSSVHGILQGRIPEWVAIPSSIFVIKPLSLMSTCIGRWVFTTSATWKTQGSIPGFPHCSRILYQPQGKPKNTGVDSLSLLQWIFLTQELNWGLLHCRQILYQLSYQGHREPLTMNKAEKTEITGWLWGETIV